MKSNLPLFGTLLVAGLLCVNLAHAQSETTAKSTAVHTVTPQQYVVKAQDGVTTQVLPNDEGFSVKSPGVELITVDLGWMPVEPGKTYRTHFRVKGEALTDNANVGMMIREHEAKGVKPITPYHRESASRRELKPAQLANWIDREISFTTGPKTHILSGAIVIAKLKGELRFSNFQLIEGPLPAAPAQAAPAAAAPAAAQPDPAQARAESELALKELRAQAATRAPLTPRPLVFSRSQMKYGLEKNYYHQWNDRPLLVNREYRVPSQYMVTMPSYKRILEEVVQYDIDGLAFFPETKGRMDMFEVQDKVGVEGVGLLPEFIGSATEESIKTKVEILERALKSTRTPRINGKVLITSYGAESLKPAEWATVLTALRQKVGDKFIFLPALTYPSKLRQPYMAGEPITRAMLEDCKAFLRTYLDVCDGIYFNYPPALRNIDRTFDGEFYSQIFIPVFKSVLAEPAYRNKYLGLSAYRSHMAADRGNTFHEDFTRTLRRSFEGAMNARPDVIVLPEWDEVNENTSFRPTLYGGTTSMRLLRYYMSQIKGKAPTPVAGDDVSVPNLVLSTRKAITLGEDVIVELLNVPDATTSSQYSAQVVLQDENGKAVHTFEPVTFDTAKLQEHRLRFPSETLPDVRALVPVLTIRGYKGRDLVYDAGFHHVQVRATWNWDYLAVKQPLRDILRPTKATFAWDAPAAAGEPLTLTGSISSPENVSLLEVLGDDDEATAIDPKNEFFRNDPSRELFLVEYRSQIDNEMTGSLTLKNATAEWLTNGPPLHQPGTKTDVKADRIELTTPVSIHIRWIYLAIPKANVGAAELDFNFDKAKFALPLREVLAKKMIARDFDNGLQITVSPYRRQIDMPMPLNQKDISFRVQVWPEINTEQYQMCVTTNSGKLFRSRPLLLPATANASKQTLRIYSDSQQRGIDVQVTADRIPEINYDFAPDRGAVLLTDAGRPFWASLGGFTSATTGRGTINGLFSKFGNYPDKVTHTAPAWVEEDGKPALQFDGVANYLELPREVLPTRGSYTMSFDIKPANNKDQVLLVSRVVNAQKGLGLQIVGGKLQATFADYTWKMQRFATGLAVPPNAWSTIGVKYDFDKLTLSVNGQSESFPLSVPSSNIGFTIIGEGWKGNWFEGRLRNLRVVQNAQ